MGALPSKENAEILILCGISQLMILAPNGIKYRKNTTGPNDPQSQMAGDGGGGPACDI